MNESDYNQWKEKNWRSALTAAEEAEMSAWLAEHPDLQRDWETEVRLTKAIKGLPDAPVPSNFTARVLEAAERERSAQKWPRVPAWRWVLRSLLPQTAVAAVVLGIGFFGYQQHETAQRAAVAQGVKVVTSVASLPSPEILQDFDTIRQMGTTPGPDPELIALMK
jgi:anti-sigma factor RsiW